MREGDFLKIGPACTWRESGYGNPDSSWRPPPPPTSGVVDTPPGVRAVGSGSSGQADRSGSAHCLGLGSGLAPTPCPSVWPGRCDPRRKSRASALDAETPSYYWRGAGSRASCALALWLFPQRVAPRSAGRSHRRGISRVNSVATETPGERPSGQRGEKLGRARGRPWRGREGEKSLFF